MKPRIVAVAALAPVLCFGGLAHAGERSPDDVSMAAAADVDAPPVAVRSALASVQQGALPGISASGLEPRVTRTDIDLGTRAGAVDNARTQPPAERTRLSDVSYRWWLSRGPADFGLGLGAMTVTTRLADGAAPLVSTAPAVTVGMRWRSSANATVFADASGAHALGPDRTDAYVGKVGVEWKPTSFASRWNVSYGGLGWRLSGDSRMSLRIKHGGVGLYMRSQF